MELVIVLVIIVSLLGLLDLAALKWGNADCETSWTQPGYDPRYNWNSYNEYPLEQKDNLTIL